MTGMPLRTRLFTTALDRLPAGASIARHGPRGHPPGAARPSHRPCRRSRWVTGRVDRSVGIGTDGRRRPRRPQHPVAGLPPVARRDTDDLPVVVFFHGGGWVLGNTVMYDPLCSHLAAEVGAVVLSVDYRMAPEHRAPTAALDCVDAVRQVSVHGERWNADTSRLAVAGDSAGGNLAAVVCQVVRDDGGPGHRPPGADLPRHRHDDEPAVDRAARRRAGAHPAQASWPSATHYRGPDGLATRDPLLSPLCAADHSGLPPALVQTADLDPLRDEGALYATRLSDAGVPVRLTNYLGAPHGFASFPGATPIAAQARAELVGELRSHLG